MDEHASCGFFQTIHHFLVTNFHIRKIMQLQKMARSLKFRIKEEKELYYPSSENKGADQPRSYCEGNLRLCFHRCEELVF